MIKKEISHIALHTNFDKSHLNRFVAEKVLGLTNIQVVDSICYGDVEEQSVEAYASSLKTLLGLDNITFTKGTGRVRRVALVTGSGASFLKNVEADCFLTGDVKYHDAMEADALNISLIDITHYGSERFFSQILCEILNHNGIKAIIKNSKDPFTILQEIK
jgi:putative NIF3 family GTP cyclohydrolase 1 type 2